MRLIEKINYLTELLSEQNFDSFFLEMANFVVSILVKDKYTNKIFESKILDALCLEAGKHLFEQAGNWNRLESENYSVYLASELYYGGGGHTLALKDIIRARPDHHHIVLLSNPSNSSHFNDEYCKNIFCEFGENVEVHIAPVQDYSHKIFWFIEKLKLIKPERLYLFNHTFDAILIGLAQPNVAKEIIFFHHCDHNLCLGVHIPYAYHIDCSELSYQQCRHQFGLKNNIFWPLTAPDQGYLFKNYMSMDDDKFTTASHGSYIKFTNLIDSNLPNNYADIVLARLQSCKGKHFHLGALNAEIHNDIIQKLNMESIDINRFVMFSHVPSLWRWLFDNKIDLCINSYPVQGFKGMVETMGAGIPMLVHQNNFSKFLSCPEFAYQGAFVWSTLSEFVEQLQGCTSKVLALHSRKSRLCYEQYHQHKILDMCVVDLSFTAHQKSVLSLTEDTLGQWYCE